MRLIGGFGARTCRTSLGDGKPKNFFRDWLAGRAGFLTLRITGQERPERLNVKTLVQGWPRSKSGKTPELVRCLSFNLITGPLNDRLNERVSGSRFPDESLEGSFRIEANGENLNVQFSANGQTERFVMNDWRSRHPDEMNIAVLRALPWKLFQKIIQTLDRTTPSRAVDDDLFVNVYPSRYMHPTPRGSHDLIYFPVFYWLVLPAWQHGKKVYKSNRPYSRWRETVTHEIQDMLLQSIAADECIPDPESFVFDELVDRLARPNNADETIKQQARLRDRQIPATAEELALDHAAYLCGVDLYEYSIRHLKELKSDRRSKRKRKRT